MSEANKAVVRRAIDIYNRADWAAIGEVMREDYRHRNGSLALTREQFVRGAQWVRSGLPDFRLAIEDILAEGDRVAARLVGRGTHGGSLFGEAPTGRGVDFPVFWILRLEDGLIVEDWEGMDEYALREAVGAVPAGA